MNRKIQTALMIVIIAALSVPPLKAYMTSKLLSNTSVVSQIKWGSGAFPIPWRLNSTQGTNVTGSVSQEDVFKNSFSAWQGLATANITLAQGTSTTAKPGYDGVNLVTTGATFAEYAAAAPGFETVLAATVVSAFNVGNAVDQLGRNIDFPGQILEADMMFNPTFTFSTAATTPATAYDLQTAATHEVGHFLGLDHSTLASATMFWTASKGQASGRVLSVDDITGLSSIYPNAAFQQRGSLTGTVRTSANVAVYGAIVTAVNSDGQPVASAITDTSGRYAISGLVAGTYTIYAEPLDRPIQATNVSTLGRIFPGATVNINFTTRYR